MSMFSGGLGLLLLCSLISAPALGRDLDQDEALELARAALAPFGDRAILERANFADLAEVAARHGVRDVRGILLDLGVSSMQLDRPERGFSFQHDHPLDMRMDDRQELTAARLLQTLPETELADVLRRYGEERMARRIARAVAAARERGATPTTTKQLADLVSQAKGGRRGHAHPATQTFQALRIAVNGELAALEKALPAALDLLAPGGRLAVISFHSLEDRMVKQFMAAHEGRMESLAKGDAPAAAACVRRQSWSRFAFSWFSVTSCGVSITGLVFAIAIRCAYPPLSAARMPVSIVSFSG